MMHILEWQKPEAYFPQAGKYMALLHLGSIYVITYLQIFLP